MTVKRVAIVRHDGKQTAVAMAGAIAERLRDRGIEIVDEEPDVVLSLGGDGTMLRAAQLAHGANVPLLGINTGTLGYLTEVDEGNEEHALDQILTGSFEIEERMMLECHPPSTDDPYVALNEVLVERSARHRLVRLSVRIGGEGLASFNADGIIVATPTGSTAYALSAGGPIVSPRTECLVVVPVNAHMIVSRPFVLAPDETVEITVDSGGEDAVLSLDGAIGVDLGRGSAVVVRRHPRRLKLVRLSGPGFLHRLRVKLGLPGA